MFFVINYLYPYRATLSKSLDSIVDYTICKDFFIVLRHQVVVQLTYNLNSEQESQNGFFSMFLSSIQFLTFYHDSCHKCVQYTIFFGFPCPFQMVFKRRIYISPHFRFYRKSDKHYIRAYQQAIRI